MDFAKVIDRVKNILLTPKTEWPVIAAENTTVADLYKNYIFVVAAIPAVAAFISTAIFARSPGIGIVLMVVQYAVALGVVYLMGMLIDAFAPTFGGEKNQVQAFKSATYAYTAGWVAGIGAIVPLLGMLIGLAGAVYSIYLLYLGLPYTMKSPQDRAGGYAAVVIIIGWAITFFASMIIGGMVFLGAVGSAITH